MFLQKNFHKSASASIVFSDAISRPDRPDDMYLILLSDNSDRRTIGDRTAKYEDWKFLVLLTNLEESKVCGGTLVATNYVLTSAWCITEDKKHIPKIFVSYNLHCLKQQDLICTYGQAVVHPDYKKCKNGIVMNDVALIRLDIPVNIPSGKTVKLPTKNPTGNPKNLKVASWAINSIIFPGTSANTEIHFNSIRTLYEIDQTFTNVQHCVTLLGIPAAQADLFICTKTHKTMLPNNHLYGEGGSPLMCKSEQIGIATGPSYRSTLEKCGLSIWTNIYPYLPWIKNQMCEFVPKGVCCKDKKTVCHPYNPEDFKANFRKTPSCTTTRGKCGCSLPSIPILSNFLQFFRLGKGLFGTDPKKSYQTNSYYNKDSGFSSSVNKCDDEDEEEEDYQCYVNQNPFNCTVNLDLLDSFGSSQLVKIFEIQVGITIFFCFLLFFKVCG